jgi:hypothetical protein
MNRDKQCSEEQLVLYHYDELSSAERQALDVHLNTCSHCRTSLEELQASLAAIPRPELQISKARKLQFAERVTKRAQRRPKNYRAAWGGALATGALVFAMFLQPTENVVTVTPNPSSIPDFEVIEMLDMLQDLDLLKDLDLLQEMGQLR